MKVFNCYVVYICYDVYISPGNVTPRLMGGGIFSAYIIYIIEIFHRVSVEEFW